MNLYQIYFSPTGGTKKVADIMSKTWNCPKIEIDLSNPDIDFSQFTFSTDDLCIVSVPCFGGRVPAVSLSRINQMTGGNAQTIIVVTYGNRAYEDTLIELTNTLKAGASTVLLQLLLLQNTLLCINLVKDDQMLMMRANSLDLQIELEKSLSKTVI